MTGFLQDYNTDIIKNLVAEQEKYKKKQMASKVLKDEIKFKVMI